jgi:3-hydroxyisobutyrate dehydrogenase-like beta-hydroxyacid dehydrogenase
MVTKYIGFIGFGEVASTFSKAMAEKGGTILVYDVLLSQEGGEEVIRGRIQADGIHVRPLAKMLARSEYVLSTVTTQVAREVARTCAPHLRPGQVYVDLNSTSPAVKVEISQIIEPSGAHFVEGAILGAVGATGAQTRLLVAGEKGEEVAKALNALGLNAAFYSLDIGRPSTFKMLRSIFSKGLEALMLEMMIAGRRAGIEEDLWADITEFMAGNPFERVAANWIQTHAVAHKRRYHEMVQVIETMREIEVEPIMTSATEAFFKRSLSLGLDQTFEHKPDTVQAVVDYLDARLREASPGCTGTA